VRGVFEGLYGIRVVARKNLHHDILSQVMN